jgi:hypothetical protein
VTRDITITKMPWWVAVQPGRFMRYQTKRSPQKYVIDRLTGTHYRIETARRRWPHEFA